MVSSGILRFSWAEHSPSEFYYPEDLETFDTETETGITESQDAI